MPAKLYVGNLPYTVDDEELRKLFSKYGAILEVNIIRDQYSGQSKGFAFVQYATPAEAQKALELDGQELSGRKIKVSEAKPPREGFRDRPRGKFGSDR